MTKPQIIREIMNLNRSARAEFLAEFDALELQRYLERLCGLRQRFGQLQESPQELVDLLEPRCPLGVN